MRRRMQLNKASRVLAAFLVLLGMSGQALGAMLCSSGLFGEGCPQKSFSAVPQPMSCHGGTAPTAVGDHHASEGVTAEQCATDSSGDCDDDNCKRSCCCEMRAAPEASPVQPSATAPPAPLLIALQPPVPDVPTVALINWAKAIFFHSDSSPPSVAWLPDFGRAPPVA